MDQLFAEALELPENDRYELATRILHSCESPDPGWWASIEPEVERRFAAVVSGEAKTTPWAEVRKMMFERANGHRD